MRHSTVAVAAERTVIDSGLSAWRVQAAYLYVLHLDPVSLAWEYLRRSPRYQASWRESGGGLDRQAGQPWGLRYLEDPQRDSRIAEPVWDPLPDSSVYLIPHDEPMPQDRFHLWSIPGDKSLIHHGAAVQLTARRWRRVQRASLAPDLADEDAYAFCVPAGGNVRERLRAVSDFIGCYHVAQPPAAQDEPARPSRSELMHLRMLQALDGAAAKASHRQIAAAVFGESVAQLQWRPDGELRAQVRYLLKRGRALRESGYRSLLRAHSR